MGDRDPAVGTLTEDRLLGDRIVFMQPATGYRAAIDPVLLAAAVPAHDGEHVLELGSGAGAAALCLAARVAGCRVTGVEREPGLVALANANAAANGMADRVRFVVGDVAVRQLAVPDGAFDHAIANPPYLEAARADLRAPGSAVRQAANVEGAVPLDRWVTRLCAAVRPKGRITLIQRADRLGDILRSLDRLAGDVAILPLWPKAGRPARRAIVTARPGTAAPLRLLAGLVLHETDGAYTRAASAVLRDGASLDL